MGTNTLCISLLYLEAVSPFMYDQCNELVILILGIGWIYIQKRRTTIRRENFGQVQQKSEQEPQVQSSQRESQTKEVTMQFYSDHHIFFCFIILKVHYFEWMIVEKKSNYVVMKFYIACMF